MSEELEDQHDVGYGKPPKNTRFQKGISGNPRGRPQKTLDFDHQVIREANLPVVINENGRQVRISKQDVAIRQLMHRAMKGEVHATRTFFGYYQQAAERIALATAQKKSDEERYKDVTQLTDEELDRLIRDSLEEEKKEEKRKQKSRRSTALDSIPPSN